MRFVIEGRGLTSGGGKVGVLQILPAMARQGRHEYVAFLPDIPEYAALDAPNLKVVLRPRCSNLLVREWWLNGGIKKICHKENAHGLFCLGNFAPHFPTVPTVIRLQNAYYIYQDKTACRGLTFRELLIVKYGREHFRRLPANVNVIVQTEVMKQHLLAGSCLSPSRVTVIPDRGMSFRESALENASPDRDAAPPFTFLCVALCSPNKNLSVLVDAIKKVKALTTRPFRCVLTIDPHQHPAAQKLLRRIERESVGNLIVNAGSLPPAQLSAAYRAADAFVLPTLLESFGRPYNEAMHFDLPVLTSDRDFARERCQNAAVYFDPLDADSIARAMARVMEDADLRRRLVENGRRVLQQSPSWEEIAAQFVEVLERTAREKEGRRPATNGYRNSAPPRSRLKQFKINELYEEPGTDEVRDLFNRKALGWPRKYGSRGSLSSRVQQFAAQLAVTHRPPAKILDFGCGTGEISAALDRMGYRVTACDFAEEMMAMARSHYARTPVDWVCLEPDWKALPFAGASFDGIVASSVFEYLDDVPRVARELSRILGPEGVLLLTVPNPNHVIRKLERRLRPMSLMNIKLHPLRGFERLDSYAAYLRTSRNRYGPQGWRSRLYDNFVPRDEGDFSEKFWKLQAHAPLILLAMKRAVNGENGKSAESILCHLVEK